MGKKKTSAQSVITEDYQSPNGFHCHKCRKCDYVWEHSDSCGGNKKQHTCPKCGEEQWTQYFGPKIPSSRGHVCTTPKTFSISLSFFSFFENL